MWYGSPMVGIQTWWICKVLLVDWWPSPTKKMAIYLTWPWHGWVLANSVLIKFIKHQKNNTWFTAVFLPYLPSKYPWYIYMYIFVLYYIYYITLYNYLQHRRKTEHGQDPPAMPHKMSIKKNVQSLLFSSALLPLADSSHWADWWHVPCMVFILPSVFVSI